MPELRKDPSKGRWVIIATERARRPGNFIDPQKNFFIDAKDCPFCHSQDLEIYALRQQGASESEWLLKVTPNGTPLLSIDEEFKRHGHGFYDVINGYGANEVIIETPDHIPNMADLPEEQIARVISTYVARFNDLKKDQHLQYICAYKNYGEAAGSRPIGHSRSQIIASPVNPIRIKEKLSGAKRYFEFHERCLYCDMIYQELKDGRRVITETKHFVAVAPFAPRFPFEVTILPKSHSANFVTDIKGKESHLAYILKDILLRFKIGLDDPAYNYILHTAPFRRKGKPSQWKTVDEDYHWHMEIVPRLAKAAGFEKGTGFYICAIPPEDTAEFLRGVKI